MRKMPPLHTHDTHFAGASQPRLRCIFLSHSPSLSLTLSLPPTADTSNRRRRGRERSIDRKRKTKKERHGGAEERARTARRHFPYPRTKFHLGTRISNILFSLDPFLNDEEFLTDPKPLPFIRRTPAAGLRRETLAGSRKVMVYNRMAGAASV